jgi:dUTP pyrophosphatase
MIIKVKIKKLVPEAKIPNYALEGDAAMDVHAVSKKVTDKFIEYGTGLVFEIPKDYVMLIFSRSSVSNKSLSQANSVGVLDYGYRGELFVRFYKMGDEEYEIGDRVAQIMVLPRPQIEFEEIIELSETERGDGGFGSTGN